MGCFTGFIQEKDEYLAFMELQIQQDVPLLMISSRSVKHIPTNVGLY